MGIVRGRQWLARNLDEIQAERAREPLLFAHRLRNGQPASINRRLTKPGRCWFRCTDDGVLIHSGESAGYTWADVSGAPDGAYPGYPGSRTGQSRVLRIVADGTQAGAAPFAIASPGSLGELLGSDLVGLWVHVRPSSTWADMGLSLVLSPNNSFDWSLGPTGVYDVGFNSNQLRPGDNFLAFNTAAASHPLGINKQAATGSFDTKTTAVNRWQIYLQVPNGQTAEIIIEGLWADWQNKPAVIIGYDDTGSDYGPQYWAPILGAKGWKGYLALSNNGAADTHHVNNLNTYAAGLPNQLVNVDAMHDAGWDIGNHTINHTNTSTAGPGATQLLTDEELRYQVAAQRDWQTARGWLRGIEFYAASQGRWSVAAMNKIRELGIVCQRNGGEAANIMETPFGIPQDGVGWLSMDSPAVGPATRAGWNAALQRNLAYGATSIFGAHAVIAGGAADGNTPTGNSLQIYENALRAWCDDLAALEAAGQISVMSWSEWWYGLKA